MPINGSYTSLSHGLIVQILPSVVCFTFFNQFGGGSMIACMVLSQDYLRRRQLRDWDPMLCSHGACKLIDLL